MAIAVPVTITAASLTRYRIACATSSGVIMRPNALANGLAPMNCAAGGFTISGFRQIGVHHAGAANRARTDRVDADAIARVAQRQALCERDECHFTRGIKPESCARGSSPALLAVTTIAPPRPSASAESHDEQSETSRANSCRGKRPTLPASRRESASRDRRRRCSRRYRAVRAARLRRRPNLRHLPRNEHRRSGIQFRPRQSPGLLGRRTHVPNKNPRPFTREQ